MHIAIPDLFACLNSAREFKSVSNEKYMEVLKSSESAKASECIKCGKCAVSCPVGAISNRDFKADEKLCIRCTKCLYVCPVSCRKMDFSAVTKRLEENFSRRKDNEYFI